MPAAPRTGPHDLGRLPRARGADRTPPDDVEPGRPPAAGRRPRTGRGASAAAHWPAALTAAGAVLWIVVLLDVRGERVGDLGLVSALPAAAFVALALVCTGCAVAVMRPETSQNVRLGHVLALVVVLYGAPHLIAEVPSFNVTWRHAGVSTYISEHGSVDPSINAYFNWPGFFVLEALAVELAGLDSALELARWTVLVFNLLYLPPLLLIARSASEDPRVPWLAATIFYLGNWVYQDYPSPQGLTFVLYLSIVAILLVGLSNRGDTAVTPRMRAALMVVCFVAVLTAVASHQLTPFAILGSVTALVLLRRTSFRVLPAIVLVLIVTWAVFAAGAYLNGHIDALKEQVGQVGATLSSSVSSRVSGSSQHVLVTWLRLATAGAVWLLALVAALRLLRRREKRFVPHIALAAVPFGLVMLQAYGGEIVLRVYFFSLPFAAVLIASLVPARTQPTRTAAVAVVVLVAASAFLVTRYGNQRIELFTADEVRVVQRAYELAPDGALLLAPNPQLPWEYARLGEVRQRTVDGALKDLPAPPPNLARAVADYVEDAHAYVLLTRNMREYEALFGRPRWGTIAQLESSMSRSPLFERVYVNRDGAIYELRPLPQGMQR